MEAWLVLSDPDTGQEFHRILNPFASCPHCDDDVRVHEWITDDDCDRKED